MNKVLESVVDYEADTSVVHQMSHEASSAVHGAPIEPTGCEFGDDFLDFYLKMTHVPESNDYPHLVIRAKIQYGIVRVLTIATQVGEEIKQIQQL